VFTEHLSIEYSITLFPALMGILQVVAAYNHLRGLQFFKQSVWSYLFAAVTLAFSLYLLFTWNFRNATGIIQGLEQSGLFLINLAIAFVCTAIISSIINHKLKIPKRIPEGVEAFRESTLFQTLQNLFGRRG
jgi:hypothetical protein